MKTKSLIHNATDWYFEPKEFEKSGKLYERLGVKKFKDFLIKRNDQSKYYLSEDKGRALRGYKKKTRQFETVHLVGTALFAGLSPITLAFETDVEKISYLGLITGANILCNIYPIMLQRYNRNRLVKSMDKQNKLKDRINKPKILEVA